LGFHSLRQHYQYASLKEFAVEKHTMHTCMPDFFLIGEGNERLQNSKLVTFAVSQIFFAMPNILLIRSPTIIKT